ncbi:unnamed protein product [Rotaria magnacalcarata]|uniref:Uncharacterized protein n=2 Tax=Rotaria magnacalcarata TaxID=392030 RepID=A0A820TRR6_9BILA|nr:unnamed protein product [Rotaria magnacalcarata]
MHQVYDNTFKDTPAADVKLIVGNMNRRSAKTELICKRPKQSLLINKPSKNNTNKTTINFSRLNHHRAKKQLLRRNIISLSIASLRKKQYYTLHQPKRKHHLTKQKKLKLKINSNKPNQTTAVSSIEEPSPL